MEAKRGGSGYQMEDEGKGFGPRRLKALASAVGKSAQAGALQQGDDPEAWAALSQSVSAARIQSRIRKVSSDSIAVLRRLNCFRSRADEMRACCTS